MADYQNPVMEKPDNTRTAAGSKISPSSFFKHSVTTLKSSPSSWAAAAPVPAAEFPDKAVYSLYSTPALQRSGSIKSLYSSPFGSMVSAGHSLRGKVRKLCSLFESPKYPSNPWTKPSKLLLTRPDSPILIPKSIPPPIPEPFRLPGTEDRVVLYFTSLGGIRRTFQDCHSTRMIFRGLRVNMDERDISMDAAYRKELQRVLGEKNISLPQVFIKGKYVGGADVVRQLLEAGELPRLVEGLPLRGLEPCEGCGDVRFVPCGSCNGSRKVFDEDGDQTRRCTKCNENGLVRCPLCCFS